MVSNNSIHNNLFYVDHLTSKETPEVYTKQKGLEMWKQRQILIASIKLINCLFTRIPEQLWLE